MRYRASQPIGLLPVGWHRIESQSALSKSLLIITFLYYQAIAPHSATAVSFGSFGFFSKTWMAGSFNTKPCSVASPIFPVIALHHCHPNLPESVRLLPQHQANNQKFCRPSVALLLLLLASLNSVCHSVIQNFHPSVALLLLLLASNILLKFQNGFLPSCIFKKSSPHIL